jgi:hypothetical protein
LLNAPIGDLLICTNHCDLYITRMGIFFKPF